MNRDILYPIRRMHGAVYEFKQKVKYWASYILPIGKKAFVIGSPTHSNLGDSAIVIAQIEFLKKARCKPERVKEITVTEYYQNRDSFCRIISKKDLICMPGGGNIGSLWPIEDEFRFNVIKDFPQNKIILFPQTVFFTIDEEAEVHKQETIKYYNNPNITLIAREKNSLALMQDLYYKAHILLAPDMVLSADADVFGVETDVPADEILFCFRDDIEQILSQDEIASLMSFVTEQGYATRRTDTHKENRSHVTVSERRKDVHLKLNEFSHAKLVLTDRLHGMVFAAITGTPCIVFDNKSNKVRGTYEWISYLRYLRFAENVEEAKAMLPELLELEKQTFDNEPLIKYFIQITEEIQKS